jgi:RNA polymerase sigma-70 factor (ECF subfamily)
MPAFEQIVNRYRRMVAALVKGMISDSARAEEIGQDVFLKLYNSLGNFRQEAKLSTYLQKIAMNECRSELRRYKMGKWKMYRQQRELDAEDLKWSGPQYDFERREIITKLLNGLPVKLREVVVLHLVQGNNTRETAEVLNLPEGTVLSRMSRARNLMKEQMKNL